jgi:hypothetical protein
MLRKTNNLQLSRVSPWDEGGAKRSPKLWNCFAPMHKPTQVLAIDVWLFCVRPVTRISKLLLSCIILLATVSTPSLSQDQSVGNPKTNFSITPRFNSAGHFPFSGALLNKNLNFDTNIYFEYKKNGFFIFKSIDLQDKRSFINYLQPGVFRKFQLSPKLKLGTFFGYVFNQTREWRDPDSDYFTAAVLYWTIHDRLKFESTSLFFDLSQSVKLANRFLVNYKVKKFQFDAYVWHRVVFDSNTHAISASLAVNFPIIRLTDKIAIQNTVSYQGYLTSSKPDFAMRKGLLISVAFPITISE